MLDMRQKEALTLALDYAKSLVVFPEFSKRHFLPLPQAPLHNVHFGNYDGPVVKMALYMLQGHIM